MHGQAWAAIKMLDISQGGFAFISMEKIAIDASRAFRFHLPGSSRLMHVEGRITHCIEMHAPPGYRLGVQFNKIDVADLAMIEWLIDHKDCVPLAP